MSAPITQYDKSAFIETVSPYKDTGNKVSRRSVISGSQNIILGGKTIIQHLVIIRGDLRRAGVGGAVVIGIGKFCLLGQRSVIRPPYKTYKGVFSYYPMKIGDYVHIGADSVVEAASIGNLVTIGKNCVIGRFTVIKDCVQIADDTVIAPGTVIASMSLYAGSPGRWQADLPEGAPELMETRMKDYYARFQPA